MIFLLEYDRGKGELVSKHIFSREDRALADEMRLTLELDLHRRQIEHEVVILEAASEEVLRRTHRRYFESAEQILQSLTSELDGQR